MLEKWSITRLSEETSMDRRTIKKLLEKAEPCDFDGDHPLYHLSSLIASMREREDDAATNLEREKTRLTKAQADKAELDLSVSRKEVVPVDVAFQTCSNLLFAVRRVIETSPLPNEQKDDIYRELQSLKPEDIISEAKFEEGEE